MKIQTQLTLAAVITAGLIASGCSQQMVAQQAAEAAAPVMQKPVTQEPVVKTVVDCSQCAKPTPKPRPMAKKCWHGRNTKGQCNPDPRLRKAPAPRATPTPRRVAPTPRIAPRPVVQQPLPRANRCWHGRNAKGQCNPRPNTAPRQVRPAAPVQRHQHRCWHGRNAKGQCNPRPNAAPRQVRPTAPAPNYQQMATPKIQPKGNFRGAIEIDGMMQQYQN